MLALTRAFIGAYGPLGDGALADMLQASAFDVRAARASLVRLERAGYVRFDANGWNVPPPSADPLAAGGSLSW